MFFSLKNKIICVLVVLVIFVYTIFILLCLNNITNSKADTNEEVIDLSKVGAKEKYEYTFTADAINITNPKKIRITGESSYFIHLFVNLDFNNIEDAKFNVTFDNVKVDIFKIIYIKPVVVTIIDEPEDPNDPDDPADLVTLLKNEVIYNFVGKNTVEYYYYFNYPAGSNLDVSLKLLGSGTLNGKSANEIPLEKNSGKNDRHNGYLMIFKNIGGEYSDFYKNLYGVMKGEKTGSLLDLRDEGIGKNYFTEHHFKFNSTVTLTNSFIQNGYKQVSYNTKPDGTGASYPINYKYISKPGESLYNDIVSSDFLGGIYVIWEKITATDSESSENGKNEKDKTNSSSAGASSLTEIINGNSNTNNGNNSHKSNISSNNSEAAKTSVYLNNQKIIKIVSGNLTRIILIVLGLIFVVLLVSVKVRESVSQKV